MKTAYLFLDLETTGLDPVVDQITEIAYILEAGEESCSDEAIIQHSKLPHEFILKSMNYIERILKAPDKKFLHAVVGPMLQRIKGLKEHGWTTHLVGANPAFDHSFLKAALVPDSYHYRLIDVECLTMQALGLDSPPGLSKCTELLSLPKNERPHEAMGDVLEARAVFHALRTLAASNKPGFSAVKRCSSCGKETTRACGICDGCYCK
jgi:oligoribonuclease (3'-5' exoribonuclease)